jgi:hypothetical protein
LTAVVKGDDSTEPIAEPVGSEYRVKSIVHVDGCCGFDIRVNVVAVPVAAAGNLNIDTCLQICVGLPAGGIPVDGFPDVGRSRYPIVYVPSVGFVKEDMRVMG